MHRGKSNSTPSLLSGRLFDTNGVRFTPTHAVKNGKRYRYYTSQSVVHQAGTQPTISRFPAQELEQFVKSQIHLLLQTPGKFKSGMKYSPSKDAVAERARNLAKEWPRLEPSRQHEFVRNVLKQVAVGQTTVWIEIDKVKLRAALLGQSSNVLPALNTSKSDSLSLAVDFEVLRRGGELHVIAPDGGSCSVGTPVSSFVKAVARARDWYERIVAGEFNTIGQLSRKACLTRRYVRRILQCANLSPQITEALLTGKHRPDLTLKEILYSVPLNWREQEQKILRRL